MSWLAAILTKVPVDPDSPTARQWLEDELSRPEYDQSPSLLQRLVDWLNEQFSGIHAPSLPSLVIILAVVAVGIVIAFVVTGPIRASRKAPPSMSVMDEDDIRKAEEMRKAADAAASAHNWAQAVIERFRAIVRSLEERAILEPRPGRTAQEAAAEAGALLPDVGDGLATAASRFDAVCYGHITASADDDALLRDVDAQVTRSRRAALPVPAVTP